MLNSHFVPLRGGTIDVYNDYISELGIRNECQLYAVELKGSIPPSIIFSPVPPENWKGAYKLSVYLSKESGTLSKAAKILSNLDINIFSSSAAAITASGEGCWTSVIELPENLMDVNNPRNASFAKEKIVKALTNEKLLINSDEFQTGLEKVILTPLEVLNNLYEHIHTERKFVGYVDNFFIDLEEFVDCDDANLYDSVISPYYCDEEIRIPNYCLVTPDTEEKYIRIVFLPENVRIIQISMNIEIQSKESKFSGYFASALEALKSLDLTIYAADNFMLKKTASKSDSSIPMERANFIFAADMSKSRLPKKLGEISPKVIEVFQRYLPNRGDDGDYVNVPKDKIEVIDILSLSQRCFFATNFRNNDSTHLYFARKLVAALRSLRLNPINVDITKSTDGLIVKEVMDLLSTCPIVVSLHLPSENNRLMNPDRQSSFDNRDYCTSDWVMFEEAYAAGLGRKIFRLLHKDVRRPKYGWGQRDFEFRDAQSFDSCLDEITKSLKSHMRSEEYSIAIRDCKEASLDISPGLLNRNIDGELIPPKSEESGNDGD